MRESDTANWSHPYQPQPVHFSNNPRLKYFLNLLSQKRKKTTLHYTTTPFVQQLKRDVQSLIAQNKTKYILKFAGSSRAFWFGELSPHIVSPIQQIPIARKPKPI